MERLLRWMRVILSNENYTHYIKNIVCMLIQLIIRISPE